MKKKDFVFCIKLLLPILFVSSSAMAADWRFPVGMTYISAFEDVVDIYEDNLEAEDYVVYDTGYWPVGLSFQPYVQFDNGLRIGAGIGPSMIIVGDVSHWDIPINLNGGYTFVPSANISPYVRAGVMYHLAGGDYVEGGTPGFCGGVGIEFLRHKVVGFGIELSYDTSEIELERVRYDDTEDVRPCELMFSIFAVF